MRDDGSIALTKLNMSVIDSSAIISSEALLCASFAQGIIDKTKENTPFFAFSELEFLEEDEGKPEKNTAEKQVNLNYDLTFEMVIAHLEALERQSAAANASERKILRETIERERRLLGGSLRILEKNSRYSNSSVVRRYLEKLAARQLKEIRNREKSLSARSENTSVETKELKLVHKYKSNSLEELIKNEEKIRTLTNKLTDRIERRSENNVLREILGDISEDYNINVLSPEKRKSIADVFKSAGINTGNFFGRENGSSAYSFGELGNLVQIRESDELAKSTKRAINSQTREIRSLKEILSSVDINTPLHVNYNRSAKNPYTYIGELENLVQIRESDELAKSTKRAIDSQMREIRSLKEILSSVDINTPLHVNYDRSAKNSYTYNGKPADSSYSYNGRSADSSYTYNGESAKSPVNGGPAKGTYFRNGREGKISVYNNLRNVLEPISREILINSIISGKSSIGSSTNITGSDRVSTTVLREILPEAGTRLIDEIKKQYSQTGMTFSPVEMEDLPVSHEMEEKVKEAAALSKKQIREVRELKKILADAEMKSPFAKENEKDSKQDSKKAEEREKSETDRKSRLKNSKADLTESNISEIVSKEAANRIDRAIDKNITEKTREFVRYRDIRSSIEKSLEDNRSVSNSLSSLTREIAVRNLMKGKDKDDLRNITKLVHSYYPWNDTEATGDIREKYTYRKMGYQPPKLEDIIISDGKDSDKEKLRQQAEIGAKKEREIRELKATLAARTNEEDRKSEAEKRKEKEEKRREKREEDIRRSIEINERIRNALSPIIREITTIRLMKGNPYNGSNNLSKLVMSALPGTDTGTIDAIRERYESSVMGFRPEKLEDLLIEKKDGKEYGKLKSELKKIENIKLPEARREREKAELRRVVGRKKENIEGKNYPPINIEYGTAYPDLLKNAVKEQVDLRLTGLENEKNDMALRNAGFESEKNEMALSGVNRIKPVSRSLSTSEKFIRGEVDETVVEDNFKPKEKTWVNPMFSPYRMDNLQFKEKNKEEEKKESEKSRGNLSDAEIRRTADKVFKLVEERIKKERRRIGRI